MLKLVAIAPEALVTYLEGLFYPSQHYQHLFVSVSSEAALIISSSD